MDWQPAGGQLVKVDTAAKLKREQVLYCALKSALLCGGSYGAASAGSISYLAGKKGLFQIEFLFIYLSAEQLSWKTTWVMPAI